MVTSVDVYSGQTSVRDACAVLVNVGEKGTPNEANPDWVDMSKDWVLIDALLSSTPGMQALAQIFIPQEEGESSPQWYARVRRSICYDMLKDAVDRLTGKPFQQPPTWRNGFKNDFTDALFDNADGAGKSLPALLREVLRNVWSYGIAYAFADMPSADQVDPSLRDPSGRAPFNALALSSMRVRPYVVHISPRDMIDVNHAIVDGRPVIVGFRYRTTVTRRVGYSTEIEARVIEWTQTSVIEHSKNAEGKWIAGPPKANPYAPRVPLHVMLGPDATSPFTARPPLLPLAYTNLAHFQSYSDQREALHTGRFSILFQTGVDDEDKEVRFQVGPKVGIKTTASKQDASLEFVEPKGTAMDAGAKDLESLERRAETQGMTPFLRRTGSTTATERGLDEEGVDTDALAMVDALERLTRSLVEDAAFLQGVKLGESFQGIDVFTDFRVYSAPAEEYAVIQKDRDRGDIGPETLLAEGIRRGIYSGDMTPKEMVDEAQQAAEPPMGAGSATGGDVAHSGDVPHDPATGAASGAGGNLGAKAAP